MAKNSIAEDHLYHKLEALRLKAPASFVPIVFQFFGCYKKAVLESGQSFEAVIPTLELFLELVETQLDAPFTFEPYNKKVRRPIDYYRFSLDFIRPLVDLPHSRILGKEHLNTIAAQLKKGENVVLLANHQTEPDPQAIAILLEQTHPEIAEKIIYVAGERVVTDPLAIPFSLGCDLLCIYSKRYIDTPPELKAKKQLHNKNTMEQMSRLLSMGGKIIYVAPSGGRDRRGASGEVEVAPFDPQSIEMFYLMAKKAKTPTHFYPFSLATYDLLPPPETIQTELGEARITKLCPIHIAFAPAFNMENFPGFEETDKTVRRQMRANAIWKIVKQNYEKLRCL